MSKDIAESINAKQWAQQQWDSAQLGDPRRNSRAVEFGAALAARPGASVPQATGNWADTKAAYRLLAEPDVTLSALQAPHWQQTLQTARQGDATTTQPKVYLHIQDGSQLDFSQHKGKANLGPLGTSSKPGSGLLLHTCLVVEARTAHVVGLAYQTTWARSTEGVHRGNETKSERTNRRTEYDIWQETIEAIGKAPKAEEGVIWVTVGDRGSDVFDFLKRAKDLNWESLIRLAQNRSIQLEDGQSALLFDHMRSLEAKGTKTLKVEASKKRSQRTVELNLTWSKVTICSPKNRKKEERSSLTGYVIRAWESNPPDGEEMIEWILWSSLAVTHIAEAIERLEWYAQRWIIEEYHKCLKSGCQIEKSQLRDGDSISRLLGFLGVIATRLLSLRCLARQEPEREIQEVVPEMMVKLVAARLRLKKPIRTVGEFWRRVAQVGGFLGRKHDGEPGWQSLWRGWQQVLQWCWATETLTG
jgi:hypothetical protein